jgi:hypothetical protein
MLVGTSPTHMRITRKDIEALIRDLNEQGARHNPPLKKFMSVRWQGRGYQLTIETANYGWQKFPINDCSIRPAKEFYSLLQGMAAMMPPSGN